ncbi:Hsp20/alpha crystallin family protein [Saccharicrinis fermentans]|uniref:Spore protein SP21 n=1 Tax=Saccharicrinis fermentans DSM 9555 = JCM 21142 TaxID=869213 RepID=W7YSU6_9BACT|nr:Hsp20/alpha crystallin family protein [Saccharicrinis fermentans]GAF05544.1 spore protein SP21 [Saccharicrinis fermentans DSM 9555 = JCM 21142]
MMTLVRRTNRNLDSFLNDFMGGDFFMNQSGMYSGTKTIPAVNIMENDDQYLIELAAAGLKKDDFNVEFHNGKLTISANKDKVQEDVNYTQREFNYAGFTRTFNVPKQKVDDGAISASYENGVLRIVLPKREEVKPKPARMVEIA